MDFDDREALMRANPKAFFVTDHYRAYRWMLVRLSAVKAAELKGLLASAWARVAPKSLVSSRPAGRTGR